MPLYKGGFTQIYWLINRINKKFQNCFPIFEKHIMSQNVSLGSLLSLSVVSFYWFMDQIHFRLKRPLIETRRQFWNFVYAVFSIIFREVFIFEWTLPWRLEIILHFEQLPFVFTKTYLNNGHCFQEWIEFWWMLQEFLCLGSMQSRNQLYLNNSMQFYIIVKMAPGFNQKYVWKYPKSSGCLKCDNSY